MTDQFIPFLSYFLHALFDPYQLDPVVYGFKFVKIPDINYKKVRTKCVERILTFFQLSFGYAWLYCHRCQGTVLINYDFVISHFIYMCYTVDGFRRFKKEG